MSEQVIDWCNALTLSTISICLALLQFGFFVEIIPRLLIVIAALHFYPLIYHRPRLVAAP